MGFLTRSHKNYTRCEEFFNSWKTAVSFQVEKIESVLKKGLQTKALLRYTKVQVTDVCPSHVAACQATTEALADC